MVVLSVGLETIKAAVLVSSRFTQVALEQRFHNNIPLQTNLHSASHDATD